MLQKEVQCHSDQQENFHIPRWTLSYAPVARAVPTTPVPTTLSQGFWNARSQRRLESKLDPQHSLWLGMLLALQFVLTPLFTCYSHILYSTTTLFCILILGL